VHEPKPESTSQGAVLIRFLSLTYVCTLVLFASLAHSQEIDVAVGGSTLFAPKSYNPSLAYPPPPQSGSTYVGASGQIIFPNHFGFNLEGAVRYHEGIYNGYQNYRPSFIDFNAVFAPHLARRTTGNFMAGIGVENLIFYNTFGSCSYVTCPVNVNSTHFLLHLGAGVRYRFLGHLFVRPEASYYRVFNNYQFASDNVFRAGASIGYTFGSE
jgi:hypothetical protein